MHITKIDNTTNFEAGQVTLKHVKSKRLQSLDAIKKIAEDRNIDISISRLNDSKYLPHDDLYSVVVAKDAPIITREFFAIGSKNYAIQSWMTSKNTKNEELSIGIYNTVMNAIESLNKKLAAK